MALPTGVTTCTVTVGSSLSLTDGSDASITVQCTPVFGGNAHTLVWSATGQTLVDFPASQSADGGMMATFVLPHVDQAGFVDGSGNAVTMWAYRFAITVTDGAHSVAYVKTAQPLVGQSTVDLDLVPDGQITSQVSAPIPAVLDVNGQTGHVTIDTGGGGTGGTITADSITDATTTGKALIRAADASAGLSTLAGVPSTRTVAGHALSADVSLVKADVGLGNVDNTADLNKPVSTATQAALDLKANTADVSATYALKTDVTGEPGHVALSSFTGADDDAKLTAAMSYAAAQTHPPIIQLGNQTYTFNGTRTPYDGFRLEGCSKIANSELSDVNMYTKLNVSGSPFWLNASAKVSNCYLAGFAAIGNSTTSFIGGAGTWASLCMRDVAFHQFLSVLGSQSQKMILSVCDFGGWWQIQGTYNGAVHIGGSDCRLWLGDFGCLVDGSQAFNTAGNAAGQYHFWFEGMDNTTIGPLYITATGLWGGIRVSGPDYNSAPPANRGSIVLTGGCVEGHNAGDPGFGSMIRVDGGDVTIRDNYIGRCMSNPSAMGHSPVDAGYVHVSGGAVLLDGTKWDRYTGQAETVPVVYQSGGWVRAINSRVATLGGQWSGLPQVKTVGGTFHADDTHTVQA